MSRKVHFLCIKISNCFQINNCLCIPLFLRWVEDKKVADRLLEIWPSILKIGAFWEKLPKSRRPSSKSYLNLDAAVKDPFTPAKLNFFSFIAGLFQPFLLQYQTDNPMVPYLYNDLITLIKKIMNLIVKPEIVKECANAADLKNVNFFSKDTFVKPKHMNIGFATIASFTELRKKDVVTSQQVAAFMNDVITFVTLTLQKIFERSPISYLVVRCSSVFGPHQMITDSAESLQSKMKKLLHHLCKLDILHNTSCDKSMEQYIELIQHDVTLIHDKFKSFYRNLTPLDDFFFQVVGIQKYHELAHVLKIILTLSHGQAAVERGFSVGKSVLNVNMTPTSIMSK